MKLKEKMLPTQSIIVIGRGWRLGDSVVVAELRHAGLVVTADMRYLLARP